MNTQQQAKHTPGPWQVAHSGSKDMIVQVDQAGLFPPMIATISGWLDDEELVKAEAQANARLIASAPALLEALQAILTWNEANNQAPEQNDGWGKSAFDRARTAIQAATRS